MSETDVQPPLIFDAHLDLAINAVSFDRDLTQTIEEINAAERHMTDHPGRGRAVVSFPEMRRGSVAACLGTLLARSNLRSRPSNGYLRVDFDHAGDDMASAAASGQLAYYRLLAARNEVQMIGDAPALDRHFDLWRNAATTEPARKLPVGIVLSVEGSDPILGPSDCERWWREGLRVASLVHYGRNRYADGTGQEGPLTDEGRELLSEFMRLGMILDVTHLSDRGFFEAIDRFDGPLLATHNNCRALVPGQRQYSDDQIRLVYERGGLVCVALDAWMLHPGWVKGRTEAAVVSMKQVADQIEHIVSVSGDVAAAAIGSDLDGGFGNEQSPGDCRSIADLQKLPSHLRDRGFTDNDITRIMHGNLLSFLGKHLPADTKQGAHT
jgi:membrane dipeptidase